MYFYILVTIMSVFEYERDAIRVKARLRSNTDDTETVSNINLPLKLMFRAHRRVLRFHLAVGPKTQIHVALLAFSDFVVSLSVSFR